MAFSEITILLCVLAVVCLSVHLMHKYWPYTKRREHNDVAGFVFAGIGVIYGVLLAFVVIVAVDGLDSARTITYDEANQLANVYWMSRGLPQPQGAAIQGLALDYAHTVVGTEWPLMEKGESSGQAQLLLDQMRDDVLGFTPRTDQQGFVYEQELTSVNALSAARRNRLAAMKETIPEPMWVVLIVGGLIAVGFCLLFGLQNKVVHAGMVASLAVLITISLLLIKNMQYPFAGDPHIGPEAFEIFLSQARQWHLPRLAPAFREISFWSAALSVLAGPGNLVDHGCAVAHLHRRRSQDKFAALERERAHLLLVGPIREEAPLEVVNNALALDLIGAEVRKVAGIRVRSRLRVAAQGVSGGQRRPVRAGNLHRHPAIRRVDELSARIGPERVADRPVPGDSAPRDQLPGSRQPVSHPSIFLLADTQCQ